MSQPGGRTDDAGGPDGRSEDATAPTDPWSADIRAAAEAVSDATMARVMDQRGVRVEDYLTVLASLTGEAVLVAAGVIDIETTELTPAPRSSATP